MDLFSVIVSILGAVSCILLIVSASTIKLNKTMVALGYTFGIIGLTAIVAYWIVLGVKKSGVQINNLY